LSCASTASSTSNAGSYAIRCSGQTSTSYTLQYVDGTLSITDPLTAIAVTPNTNPQVPIGQTQQFTVTGTFGDPSQRQMAGVENDSPDDQVPPQVRIGKTVRGQRCDREDGDPGRVAQQTPAARSGSRLLRPGRLIRAPPVRNEECCLDRPCHRLLLDRVGPHHCITLWRIVQPSV
jgi:hypothetical protein